MKPLSRSILIKPILLFLLVLFCISCNKENKKPLNIKPEAKTETVREVADSETEKTIADTTKKITIGYSDTYEKLPKLVIDTISEKEFDQLKDKKYLEKVNIQEIGNFFYIQTEHTKHKFKKYKDYGGEDSWSGFDLLGYYSQLKLFAITDSSTAEHMGFGELFLLDYTNDYQYNIVSFGDGSVELPIPSVNNKYLVYYYNLTYESQNCDIGVLKINEKADPKKFLTEAASYKSDQFKVEKIVWKTDCIFYIKGYKEVDNQKLYSYYKAEIKS